jgi:hypothetical protein
MGLVLGLIVLALIFGLVGLVVRAARWLLIIALVLLAVGIVRGMAARNSTRA